MMNIEKYLRCSPIFAMNSAVEAVFSGLEAELKAHHVHFLEGLLLTALVFEGRETSPSELATTFRTSRANISSIIKTLEKKRWLQRRLDPQDKRRFRLALSAEGRKKGLQLIRIYDRLQSRLEENLGVRDCATMAQSALKLRDLFLKEQS